MENGKDITLREYIDLKICGVNKEIGHLREKVHDNKELYFSKAEGIAKALEKQEEELDKRFTDINPVLIAPIRKDLNKVMEWKSYQEGKASKALIISVASIIVAIVSFLSKYF